MEENSVVVNQAIMEAIKDKKPEALPLVSVIVPVYKQEKYLSQCVDSLLMQTYFNLEIILVDDGSPDNCPAICDEYHQKDSRIVVLHKENAGVSSARNSGMEIAKGDWIAFVDSDDIVSERYIETMAKYISSPEVLPCVQLVTFSETVQEQSCSAEPILLDSFKRYISCHGGYPVAALYNAAIIKENGLRFNESITFVEDVLWNFNYFCYSNAAVCEPVKLYHYRQHPTASTAKCKEKQFVVATWMNIRNIGMEWFFDRGLGKKSDSVLKNFFRLCNNNIISESVSAKFGYSEYRAVRKTAYKIKSRKRMFSALFPEFPIETYFTRLYYFMYCLAFKMLKRRKK